MEDTQRGILKGANEKEDTQKRVLNGVHEKHVTQKRKRKGGYPKKGINQPGRFYLSPNDSRPVPPLPLQLPIIIPTLSPSSPSLIHTSSPPQVPTLSSSPPSHLYVCMYAQRAKK